MTPGPSRSAFALVVLLGLLATAGWSAVLAASRGLAAGDVALVATTGAAVTLACSTVAFARDRRHRATGEDLERAEHKAVTDPLTGLLNRAGMFAELQASLPEARRSRTVLGVLFLDLDRFKVVNDSLGHAAGDELLRIVASRLVNTVRSTDLVARFGGDEFVVVCRGMLSGRAVQQVARSILAAFAEPISLRGASQVVGTSIGIAITGPDDERGAEELVRDADTAMYRAKRTRSGLAVFDEAERLRAVDRMDTERDLFSALADGQMVVHYQPIVALPDCEVASFEALVRWNHPTRGLLGPGAFLDVAEEAGLMSVLGDLVLREACAQKAVWNHLDPRANDMRISVNVAEQQLHDAGFVDRVVEILDWAGLPADQLVLEITETVITAHLGDLSGLRRLRELGVNFAIDDFGTGQSSLSMVRQLDMVSILKLDKEFVSGLRSGTADGAIIEAVVSMARALRLAVVAEGVEDAGQLADLQALGVDMVQGYLFNRPMAASDIDPGRSVERGLAPRGACDGVSALDVSRSLLAEPRSRSAPRPLPPRPVRGPGTSGPA